MGMRRAHQHTGERARKLDVGDEAPAPEQEAAILDAAQRRADALVVGTASLGHNQMPRSVVIPGPEQSEAASTIA